jgi:hypothetical protein
MLLQAHLPVVLAAIHNFIHTQDPEELTDFIEAEDLEWGFVSEELAMSQTSRAERAQANVRQDVIASEMWAQYQAELQCRGKA